MTAPVDLEVAIRGWTLAGELRAICGDAARAIESTGDLSAGEIANILGTLLGQLDIVAGALENVKVEL